jgi:putative transposase
MQIEEKVPRTFSIFWQKFCSCSYMPRKILQRNNSLPYHVTARSNNREHFKLPLERLWLLIANECLSLRLVYGVEFQALVLMPNHFHMLLTVPEQDLGKVMSVFLSSVTRTGNLLSNRSGHIFGGPYHWSLINNARYYGHALKYVYRNPVRAKLCASVEDYRFSTVQGLIGNAHLPFAIHLTRVEMEFSLPSTEILEQLEWLNKPFPIEADYLIQKGLRKKLFGFVADRKTHPLYEPLNRLL